MPDDCFGIPGEAIDYSCSDGAGGGTGVVIIDPPPVYSEFIRAIATEIAETLLRKDKEYGGSWLKRGGVGAYMMKVRKSDRLEEQVKKRGYDVFEAIKETRGSGEPISDTLLDDAGYAILILAEARCRGLI